jgi:hypothetical protein
MSSSPIETLTNVSSVQLSVTDHPLIVEVEPQAGIDTLVLNVGESASSGQNAEFTVSVDGTQIGGVQTVTAAEAAGGGQNITLTGPFGAAGAHDVTVNYINASGDGGRMLFVNAISVDGLATFTDPATVSSGVNNYTVQKPAAPLASNAGSQDTLVLNVSETAASGKNALFMVSVDGQMVGGIEQATASHAKGKTQNITLSGDFGSGPHTVAIDFVNGYSGNASDAGRTLYVNSISFDGVSTTENASQSYAGAVSYTT